MALEQYDSALNGPQMDSALLDMANHTSERYAKGTVEGVEVTSGVGYHDNSKYYAQQASAYASSASAASGSASSSASAAATSASAANASKTSAASSASSAANSAAASEASAQRAEAIVGGHFVSYGEPQSLTAAQKAQARENIGLQLTEAYVSGKVLYLKGALSVAGNTLYIN